MRLLLFALFLIFAPLLWAQETVPTQQGSSAESSETEDADEQDAAKSPQAGSSGGQAQTNTQGSADRGSPFEYEASEQISEDLSVSFPVDI